MNNIIDLISGIHVYITIGLILVIFILFILLLIAFSAISKLEKRYRKFMRGQNNKNIEELIIGYLDKIDETQKSSQEIKAMYEEIITRLNTCIQKTSIIRYKAFEDVGSDLSFSLALLDDSNSGIILTGIYGRNESTTYAKPIDKGISRYDLSEEEIHVLNEATNKYLIKNKK